MSGYTEIALLQYEIKKLRAELAPLKAENESLKLDAERLDWAVSITLGHRPEKDFHSHGMTWNGWWETAAYIDTKPNEYRRIPKYSTDWSQGGPIIERERIQVFPHNGASEWCGVIHVPRDGYTGILTQDGPTPLIAAMRCYCCAKLGDEFEIPKELL